MQLTSECSETEANQRIATKIQLHLAVITGYKKQGIAASRRAALIGVLAEGKPLTGKTICKQIEQRLGVDCWGIADTNTLRRDIGVLRKHGVRIGYSRQKSLEGFYLKFPMLEKETPQVIGAPLPKLYIDTLRAKSTDEKLAMSFGLADFALQQKRLILRQQHPDKSSNEIDHIARAQVFGLNKISL